MVKEESPMTTISLYLDWSYQKTGNLQELFRSMQSKACIRKIASFLSGHSRNLLDLTTEISKRRVRRQHYAGSRTVAIHQIKGSEGRARDFDCDFNPLHSRTSDRWMSIANARTQGDALPLVELIQLGDDYFVRDGHHRISVACAFGEAYIDANVIVLEFDPASFIPSVTTFGVDGIQQR